jgi:TonB family protein
VDRLRQPGDSDYDVLGVSPGATGEEINDAFNRLIDKQGYKVGVPREHQWARAREIRAAHATLSDPLKRKAYDESLGRVPEQALWGTAANDAATDELVRPQLEQEQAAPVENRMTADAFVSPGADAWTPPPARPEPELEPPEAEPRELELLELESPEPEPEPDEVVWPVHDWTPPADLDPEPDEEDRRGWGKIWGLASAVALGLLGFSSWLGWNRQEPTAQRGPTVTTEVRPLNPPPPDMVYPLPPDSLSAAGASRAKVQALPPGQSPAARGAVAANSRPENAANGTASQKADELAPLDRAEARGSDAATASAGNAPATEPAAPAPSQQAEAKAPPPPPPVVRPPPIAAPRRARMAPAAVRSPPRWLGGGPTDSDNRRGIYQGTVSVRLTVGSGGRVSNCVPVRRSGNAGLDAMTCRIVEQRARFAPALDTQGRPVASEAFATYVWTHRRRR